MTDISDVMAKARLMRPYLGRAITALQPVKREKLDTITVDKWWRLYYDPAKFEEWEWGLDGSAGAVITSVVHLLRKHHQRSKEIGAQALPYAVAASMEVLDDLVAEELPLPPNPLTPNMLGFENDDLAESYYYKLLDKGDWPSFTHGSGVAGDPKEFEEKGPTDSDTPGMESGSSTATEKQVAQDIRKEAQNNPGTVPAHWREWADAILKPSRIPWEKLLGVAIRRAVAYERGRVDFSYARLSRRQGGRPEIRLPASVKPRITVGVLLDTSGSMSKEMLDKAMSETIHVAKANGAPVVTVACDAAVHSVVRVKNSADFQRITGGGGGTDMRVGMTLMEEKNVSVVVVLTDGCTPWPSDEPPYRTVVGLIGGVETENIPSWANVVVIKENEDGEEE